MLKNLKYALLILISFASLAHHTGDTEYFDTKISGIGFTNGASDFQFTIDHPSANNIVFTLDEYTEQNKEKLFSIILAAYHTQDKIKLITWGAAPVLVGDSRYVKVRRLMLGREF